MEDWKIRALKSNLPAHYKDIVRLGPRSLAQAHILNAIKRKYQTPGTDKYPQ